MARASLDPPEGEESAWLLSMQRALDGVTEDMTDHSLSTRACFVNVWRRIVGAVDENMMAEDAKLEEESDTSRRSEDKLGEKRKLEAKEEPSDQESPSLDEAVPPLSKKLRPVPLVHEGDDVAVAKGVAKAADPPPADPPPPRRLVPTAMKAAGSTEKPQLRSPQRTATPAPRPPFVRRPSPPSVPPPPPPPKRLTLVPTQPKVPPPCAKPRAIGAKR